MTRYQLKQASFALRQRPGFVFIIVSTLGLALGVLLCIITLADQILLKPLPYPEHNRLYRLASTQVDGLGEEMGEALSHPVATYLEKKQTVFSEFARVFYGLRALTSSPTQATLQVNYASPSLFPMLDIPMAIGRGFEESEAYGKYNPVVLLSYKFWQDQFDGEQDILGREIELGGETFRIIGVTSQKFVEPQLLRNGRSADVWLPWDYTLMKHTHTMWFFLSYDLYIYGRLKPEYSVAEAEQNLSSLVNDEWRRQAELTKHRFSSKLTIRLDTLNASMIGECATAIYLLLLGAIGLIIIACVNISNLMMSHVCERQREFSICAAMGARRKQVFYTLFTEVLLIVGLSCVIAFVIAFSGVVLLQNYFGGALPRINELHVNFITCLSALILVLTLAYVLSLVGVRTIRYRSLITSLNGGGKGTGIQVSKKARQILVFVQVTIAAALVFVNISLFRDASDAIDKPLGINIEDLVNVELFSYSNTGYSDKEILTFIYEIKRGLKKMDGVVDVSISGPPHYGFSYTVHTTEGGKRRFLPQLNMIDHKYFSMLDQQFIEGRNYSESDFLSGNGVIIINDVFANVLSPGGSALGKVLLIGDMPLSVVGVVKALEWPGQNELAMRSYPPIFISEKLVGYANKFLVKHEKGKTIQREDIVTILRNISDKFQVFLVEPLVVGKSNMLARQIMTVYTTAALSVVVLILSLVGLYGVFSYGIQLRRFELGTRMAVGARRWQIFSLVVRDNIAPVLLGLCVSIAFVFIVYTLFQNELLNLLGRTDLSDLIVNTVLTLLILFSLMLFSCYWPLRQYLRRPAVWALRGVM